MCPRNRLHDKSWKRLAGCAASSGNAALIAILSSLLLHLPSYGEFSFTNPTCKKKQMIRQGEPEQLFGGGKVRAGVKGEWVSEWVSELASSHARLCCRKLRRPTLSLINIHADVFVWRQSRWHDVTWPLRVTKKRRPFWPQRSVSELLSLILNTPNSTLQHVMSSTYNRFRYIGNTEADIQKTTWSSTVNRRPICIRRNGRFMSWWFLTIFDFCDLDFWSFGLKS